MIIFYKVLYIPHMQSPLFTFTATVIPGSHRGKGMGTPTLNLNLDDVPIDMQEGIYACFVIVDNKKLNAAMHYGPRPVHKDSRSCEVHALDTLIQNTPETVTVEVIEYLRPVADFPSEDALKLQIADDIKRARGILSAYGVDQHQTADS